MATTFPLYSKKKRREKKRERKAENNQETPPGRFVFLFLLSFLNFLRGYITSTSQSFLIVQQGRGWATQPPSFLLLLFFQSCRLFELIDGVHARHPAVPGKMKKSSAAVAMHAHPSSSE